MIKKLFFIPLILLSGYFLYATCIDKIITTKTYSKCTSTTCLASSNGNCYKWKCNYSNEEEETEECKESCNLKKCNNWERSNTVTGENRCVETKVCCERSGPELNASCKNYCCPRILDETRIKKEKCTQAICN